MTISAAAEPPLPDNEIAEPLLAASEGDPDAVRRARLLAQRLPEKIGRNLLAEVSHRVLAAPSCEGQA
jgi:hypothetical protein